MRQRLQRHRPAVEGLQRGEGFRGEFARDLARFLQAHDALKQK